MHVEMYKKTLAKDNWCKAWIVLESMKEADIHIKILVHAYVYVCPYLWMHFFYKYNGDDKNE